MNCLLLSRACVLVTINARHFSRSSLAFFHTLPFSLGLPFLKKLPPAALLVSMPMSRLSPAALDGIFTGVDFLTGKLLTPLKPHAKDKECFTGKQTSTSDPCATIPQHTLRVLNTHTLAFQKTLQITPVQTSTEGTGNQIPDGPPNFVACGIYKLYCYI